MQEGRNMTMMMAPSKAVLAGKADSAQAVDEVFPADAQGDVAEEALELALESGSASSEPVSEPPPSTPELATEAPQSAAEPAAEEPESAPEPVAEEPEPNADAPLGDSGTAAAGSTVS